MSTTATQVFGSLDPTGAAVAAPDSASLPSDWPSVALGTLCSFANGVNADKSAYGKGVPFINVLEVITRSHLQASDIPGRVLLSKVARETFAVRRGDILFNRTSETQEEVGLSAVYDDDATVVFGGFVIRGRFTVDAFDRKYLGYALRAPMVRHQIIAQGQGAIRANIGQANLKRTLVPIPPKREQRAIAEALSDVDGLLGALEKLIAKKRAIKHAAMQQLLTGKTRLPGFSGQWETTRLGAVLEFEVGYPFSSKYFNAQGSGLRLIKNRDLKADDDLVYYSGPYTSEFLVDNGDVLVGMDGDFTPHIWKGGNALLNQRVGRLCASSGLDVNFAYYYLGEPLKEIERATSSTTVKHLSHGQVEDIVGLLPEIAEQTAIATILADMDADIAALEACLTKTRAVKQGMMQQLLTGRTRLVTPQPAAA